MTTNINKEVDIRTDEEKLRDNLAAALPEANGEFKEYFAPVELTGISAVYEATNGKGFVYVVDDAFVAVDNDGKVIGEVDATVKALVEEQAAKVVEIKNAAINLSEYNGLISESVVEAYRENGGYVITLNVSGFNPDMVIKCTVKDGAVVEATCLSSKETLGHEKTYGANFSGVDVNTVNSIDTVSGATMTTSAYKNAVRDALNAALVFGGGEAVKSEEEIFAENLAAALPMADTLATAFLFEKLDGIDAVYTANNETGYVFIVGENFVGVDTAGNIIGEFDEQTVVTVTAAYEKLSNTTVEELDLSAYADMPASILSAAKTSSGNYIFEVKAAGYGINGGSKYHPASGEYIYIKVSVSSDGEIIACQTTYQNESANIGDKCAAPEYYSQYNGRTAENYSEVDTIAGATITSNGYTKAIGNVFEAVKILNGGAK